MPHSPLDRNQLRRRLNDALRTDPDLNAFCLDYFPEVYRRFAGGMDRTDKVNLLLQLAPESDQILGKLGAYSAVPREKRFLTRAVLPLAMAVTIALAAGIYTRFLRHLGVSPESRASPAMTPAAALAGSLAKSIHANSGNVIDRSPGAEMHNKTRLPPEKPPSYMNSDNRIHCSRGAKMDNSVKVTP